MQRVVGFCSLSLLSLVLALGCSDAAPEESVGESTSDLDQSCAYAAPMAVISGRDSYVTPDSYNPPGCYKGAVVKWTRGTATGATLFQVIWLGPQPSTQEECAAAVMSGYAWERLPNGQWGNVQWQQHQGGNWNENRCSMYALYFNIHTDTMKFAVSGRTANTSSAPTRKLQFVAF